MKNIITIEHTLNGYISISAVVNGYRVHKLYSGYTPKEAKQLFRESCKNKCCK